jgi:hypothetical protein
LETVTACQQTNRTDDWQHSSHGNPFLPHETTSIVIRIRASGEVRRKSTLMIAKAKPLSTG